MKMGLLVMFPEHSGGTPTLTAPTSTIRSKNEKATNSNDDFIKRINNNNNSSYATDGYRVAAVESRCTTTTSRSTFQPAFDVETLPGPDSPEDFSIWYSGMLK